jgi:hypothetical protein
MSAFSKYWYYVSRNKFITLDDVAQNLDLPWNWNELTYKTSFKTITANKHLPWYWNEKIRVLDFDIQFVKDNPQINFDWSTISRHALNITDEFVEQNLHLPWNWEKCVQNIYFPIKSVYMIIARYGVPWTSQIMDNANITMDFIKNNPQLKFDYDKLTYNRNIKFRDIKQNSHLPWQWNAVCHKEDYIADNFNEDRIKISSKASLPYILAHPELNWSYSTICFRADLEEEIIEQNLHLPWDWQQLSFYGTLSMEFIRKHKDKLSAVALFRNHGLYDGSRFHYSINKDIKARQNRIDELLRNVMIQPFMSIVCKYIDYI